MTDDNVTPITPSHVCASCKATIETRDVYEGHTDQCMQPEIRMRRLEAHVRLQSQALIDLQAAVLADLKTLGAAIEELAQAITGNPNTVLLKETHGTSEASPDTQRSGEPVLEPGDGLRPLRAADEFERQHADDARAYVCRLPPYPGGPLTNPGAAEPERPPDAGADASREEPGQP